MRLFWAQITATSVRLTVVKRKRQNIGLTRINKPCPIKVRKYYSSSSTKEPTKEDLG
jgi:hypothetical protein